jgi:hydroxypyruvate reductase
VKDALRSLFAAVLGDLDLDLWMPAAAPAAAPLRRARSVLVIAFGKAARPMTAAAMRHLLPGADVRGLVVPPEPDDAPLAPFEVIPGGHPLPTAGSVRAAARALELCRGADARDAVLFLVSGGGSAMLELPADAATPLDELRALYRALVGSGAGIDDVNVVRARLSAIKDGRLAAAAARPQAVRTVAISDVPDGSPWLASSPTIARGVDDARCLAVLDRFGLRAAVPPRLLRRLLDGSLPAPPPAGAPDGRRSQLTTLLDNGAARAALRRRAEALDLLVVEDQSVDDLPFADAADRLLLRLRDLARRSPDRRVAVLTGGELSVPLPPEPGRGGRNQQFALACALRIQGEPITVLSAGTDGIDGSSPAAGALADGGTVARARSLGLDAEDHLRRCDAFPLLEALDGTIVTGPTGTNVRDLRLLVHG